MNLRKNLDTTFHSDHYDAFEKQRETKSLLQI